MNCNECESLISPFVDCELPDEEAEAVQRHLQSCERCRQVEAEIIRVGSVEFTGKEYEDLRQSSGDIEIKRRQLEFDQRLRDLVVQDKMAVFKTDQDLEEYVAQLAHEKEVGAEHRDHETVLLKQVQSQEIGRKDAAHQMAMEMDQVAHEIGMKVQWDDHNLSFVVKEAEAKAGARRIEEGAEADIADKWLDVKSKKQQIDRDDLAGRAEILKGSSIQEMIALLPDEAKRAELLELNRQSQLADKTPEQILAMSKDSPAAMEALTQMAGMRRDQLENEFKDKKEYASEWADRLERVMRDALKTTSDAAKDGDTTTQIIK